MKDSGVEWLGEMPAHWEVRRLRNAVTMRVSNVDKHVREGETPVRLCNYVDVYKHDCISQQIDFMRATATPEEIKKFRLEEGDVLITKDSEAWDDIGVPAVVTEPSEDLISGYHLALLRPFDDVLIGGYLLRSLQSKGLAHQLHVAAKGVTRYGLSHAGIKSVWLAVPPHPEQIRHRPLSRPCGPADSALHPRQAEADCAAGGAEAGPSSTSAVTGGQIDVRTGQPYPSYKPSGVEWLGDVPEHWEVRRLRNAVTMRVSNVDKRVRAGSDSSPVFVTTSTSFSARLHQPHGSTSCERPQLPVEIAQFRLEEGDVLITKDSEAWDDIGVPAVVTEPARTLRLWNCYSLRSLVLSTDSPKC